jgi:hypothetical protein
VVENNKAVKSMIELVEEKDIKKKCQRTKKIVQEEGVDNDIGVDLSNTIRKINYKESRIIRKELKVLKEEYGKRWMDMKWNAK